MEEQTSTDTAIRIIPHNGVGRDPASLVGQYIQPMSPPPKDQARPFKPKFLETGGQPDRIAFRISTEATLRFDSSNEIVQIMRKGDRERYQQEAVDELTDDDWSEMDLDYVLEMHVHRASEDQSRQTGLRIEEAVLGLRKSVGYDVWQSRDWTGAPVTQEHQVLGLRLEGMEKIGYIACCRYIEEDEYPIEKPWFDVMLLEEHFVSANMDNFDGY